MFNVTRFGGFFHVCVVVVPTIVQGGSRKHAGFHVIVLTCSRDRNSKKVRKHAGFGGGFVFCSKNGDLYSCQTRCEEPNIEKTCLGVLRAKRKLLASVVFSIFMNIDSVRRKKDCKINDLHAKVVVPISVQALNKGMQNPLKSRTYEKCWRNIN